MVANLQEELKESRRKISDTSEKLGSRIQVLTRENDLLKHQLKKYVGAVQKLRDGPMAFETVTL
jgi:sorting nexin-29